jgi:hypothetical protein
MPSLAGAVRRFSKPFTTVPGDLTVYGQVNPPDGGGVQPEGQFTSRATLITAAGQNVTAGMLVQDADGTRFLLGALSPDTFGAITVARRFGMYQVNNLVAWQRSTSTLEPISGLRVPGPLTAMGSIYCLVETMRQVSGGVQIEQPYVRILTNAALLVDDLIDSRRVRRVSADLGLTYAEAL